MPVPLACVVLPIPVGELDCRIARIAVDSSGDGGATRIDANDRGVTGVTGVNLVFLLDLVREQV